MGSSAKKKKEKKNDFQVRLLKSLPPIECVGLNTSQKPKLKVGKARPKAENHTDTSFRSKGNPEPFAT